MIYDGFCIFDKQMIEIERGNFMIQSFDFMREVWRNKELEEMLLKTMDNQCQTDVRIGAYRLLFDFDAETIQIDCHDETYYWKHKIVPVEITFKTLHKLLVKDFDDLEIRYL